MNLEIKHMDINELCLELKKLLHESGWLTKATEFFQNHPELYSKSNGYIASLTMALSFQPDICIFKLMN